MEERIPFRYKDMDYEIKVEWRDGTTYVRAYLNNEPVNQYTYHVCDFTQKSF